MNGFLTCGRKLKELKTNCPPVLILPIFGKIFEKINLLFKYLDENNLLNSNQSGFCPGYSCAHQLLAISNNIHKAFQTNISLELRGVFLGLSKVFDRVWHAGQIYKLNQIGICGTYYGLINSFLSNQYQRVVLNGQSSYWS